ncbi:endonuclease/exonuclease/phosphatase family protein [Sphingobium sp. Sx8-8]|uniref:endonuclease/exonuclease/phosphatase family protein n=1 Tax=Sphingobium sp. Sx8-8 TaxID=2933617 RepID=UPI001F5AE4FC|nr:endonuclease/exonuclease/phosphatase family protein [Sphingobium sp. Sx8-8]
MSIAGHMFRMLAAAALLAVAPSADTRSTLLPEAPSAFDGTLPVMTYNIHGLPWPVAWGRDADFTRIAARLRLLRGEGRNPHIVVLQEAFTQEAQAIGREAGYRYIATGADQDAVNGQVPTASDRAFAAAESWSHGEGLPKFVGSGLQILSDYPIVDTRRIVFPAFACAGFDCLANKGALLARIRLPGQPEPVDIVTTHLNSRRASGVANDRSNHAYGLQLACLGDFIRSNHDPRNAMIVAGDFNMGHDPARRSDLLTGAFRQWLPGAAVADAYDEAGRKAIPLNGDARYSRYRARDWEFFTGSPTMRLSLRGIDVPFGHAADGSMLSDHVGYTAIFDVKSLTTAAPVKA